MLKLLDKIFNSKLIKSIITYVILIIIFYVFKIDINNFIYNYLLIKEEQLKEVNLFWYILLSIIGMLYIIYKLILKKYQPSVNLIHLIFISTLFISILRLSSYSDGWQFIGAIRLLNYIDILAIIPLFLSSLIIIIKSFLKPKEINNFNNPFVADDPIDSAKNDKLNYKKKS
ncbi:hypothetical protein IZU89_15120 [Cellulophaga lytica]|uniref:hypothetical protein n=1 Tax=Cellulophaga lytica TaxID=979 RepID=UPI0032E39BEA